MIGRMWKGCTNADEADRYLAYLEKTGVTDCAATDGNRGVLVLRRVDGSQAEFIFLSFWENAESMERFAGPQAGQAVYYPQDREFLLEMTPGVELYEAFVRKSV